MINILFISTYTGIGGGENLQLNLMRALDHKRYSLHLLTPKSGAFTEAASSLGVVIHTIPFRGTSTFFVPSIWSHFPIVAKLNHFLRENNIQVVFSDYHSLPFIVPAGERNNIPVIWNAMGWWFPIHRWQRDFYEHRVGKILAITGAVKDRLLGTPPKLPPELIDVIIPGVDPETQQPKIDGSPVREKLGISPDIPLVAMVARFQNVKGHEYFIDAARLILKAVPDARFAVAGENVFSVTKDETYKQNILLTVRNNPLLRDRITYLGFWPDAREVIAAADVMVCSSWFESLSMVALESMAMEKPIVSTKVGGPAETIVDGVTGYLVEPRNSKAIAERVIELLRDPALRRRMGKAGRLHVSQNFSAHHYAEEISAVIESMVK
jgi:glycosyltransferase involved in cell wall biosynthesis